MSVKRRFFIKTKAFQVIRQRALEKSFNVKTQTDLADQRILPWNRNDIRKYLNGERPVNSVNAQLIRDKLDMTVGDWERITELRVEDLETLLREFFAALRVQGVESAIAFFPRTIEQPDPASYCVSARVITDEEWNSLLGQRHRSDGEAGGEVDGVIARRATGVLLNTWLRRARSRVVLKGEPGEGKTTALWLFVADICRRWEQAEASTMSPTTDSTDLIPLVLPLRQIPSPGFEKLSILQLAIDHIVDSASIDHELKPEVRDWLQKKSAQGQFVLLLDGLDELPSPGMDWLRAELAALPQATVILTTRYHADPGKIFSRGFEVLRMVPLRWWVIDQFISNYFAGFEPGLRFAARLRAFLRANPAMRQLAQNPLLLAVTCHLTLSEAQDDSCGLPTTKAGLLGAALRASLERGDHKFRRVDIERPQRNEDKIEVLAELAWHFQRERPIPMMEVELLERLTQLLAGIRQDPPKDAQRLLREFVEDGVLIRRGFGPYNFSLRRFQEYCLARHIARLAASSPQVFPGLFLGRARAWRRPDWPDFRPLNQPDWGAVWPLVAGCCKSNEAFLEALVLEQQTAEDLMHTRLRLLASCLGEYLETNRDYRVVWQRWLPEAERVAEEVLRFVRDETLTTGLPGSWRTCLAQLPPRIVTPKLAKRLAGPGEELVHRNSYALALGEVGTMEASQYLQQLVSDDDADDELRANAASALGIVGDTTAREILLLWLNDQNRCPRYLRFGCIVGLSYVADEKARRALASLIHSPETDSEARWQCIQECERLFGPEIEQELLRFIQNALRTGSGEVSSVHERDEGIDKCAEILGRIGGPESARAMLALIRSSLAANVKLRICDAVAQIGDEDSRAKLRAMVQGGNRDLSNFSALALIRVGDEACLPALLHAASDTTLPEHLRASAAEACRHSWSPIVPGFLKERLLQDVSPKVQMAAAMSLAYQGGPLAVAALKEALAHRLSQEVELECARGLAVNGESLAEAVLTKVLEDRNRPPHLRVIATNALGQLPGEVPRTTLRRICQDASEQEPIRKRCADALSSIQRHHGWRPLINGNWDPP